MEGTKNRVKIPFFIIITYILNLYIGFNYASGDEDRIPDIQHADGNDHIGAACDRVANDIRVQQDP